jgi:hypothetical protein
MHIICTEKQRDGEKSVSKFCRIYAF